MAIKLEKILTISATEWFSISGKSPGDFEAVGVHIGGEEVSSIPTSNHCRNTITRFAEQVPDNTMVVVGYRVKMEGKGYAEIHCERSGTALVSKKSAIRDREHDYLDEHLESNIKDKKHIYR